jgi:cytochrome b561
MLSPSQTRYNRVAVILHWVIALLIVFLLFPGEEFMEVRRGGDLTGWQPTAHASLGSLVLLLTVVRIGWRMTHIPVPHNPPLPRWQAIASETVHGLFYVLMLALPLTGLFALQHFGAERLNPEAVTFFKTFSLYGLPDLGGWVGEAHEIAGTAAKALLALHVLAALKHQFLD